MRGAYRLITTRVTALTAGVALTVSGCSDAGPEPSPTAEAAPATSETVRSSPPSEPSPESSATPSPAPTLRPVPPEATELSEAGALAFLDWWVDMYNYVEATGETDLVFEHSEPGCTFCQNFVDRVDPVYTSGGRVERRPPTQFEGLTVEELGSNDFAVVTARVNAGSATTYDAEEITERQSSPTKSLPVVVGIQWTAGEWLLADIGPEETST